MKYELCPSMLSADFNRLGEDLSLLEREGVRVLHIDVMDGEFVPSISFGMPVIRSIRRESKLFFDVHLMVREPGRYIREFASCGADSITIHLEACEDAAGTLRMIRDCGVRTAISIKPQTDAEAIRPYLELVDMILIMTVEPGFGGQKYIESSTEKIRRVRAMVQESGREINIQVDGGINNTTLETVMRAGANYLVAGSAVFGDQMEEKVRTFKKRIAQIEETL